MLAANTRLGPYEIVSLLGAGGMGEVYRARDPRLGREVAIKILAADLAADDALRQRFEREARTIAKITHPHICALHDVGREGNVEYLVMELLEGETLAARLARGPLPMDQVLRSGEEITSALAAAHAHGIIHRDLKPANIMITRSGVKLLDFGLARAFARAGDPAATASMAIDRTEAGMVLGTAPYMAPEQVEGKEVDPRTDMFALGAVLFEMATGSRAFAGASPAAVLSSVLRHEPPSISSLQPGSSPAFDRLVRRCLAKDPAARWNSAADLEHQLREISEVAPVVATAAPTAGRARTQWISWAVAVLATGFGLFSLFALYHKPTPAARPAQAVRLSLPPPEGGEFSYRFEGSWMAVSPDGSQLAYLATDAKGLTSAWLRPLDATQARRLPSTEDASSLFWSPDGRTLGFFAGARMLRLDLVGGSPVPICDVPASGGMTGTWGKDEILFCSNFGSQVFRVAAAGGTPVVAVASDTAKGERRPKWPWFLPDGRSFLYLNRRFDSKDSLVLVTPGAPRRAIMAVTSKSQFTAPDWLTFVREGTLLGQRFDPRSGRLVGAPFAVADPVRYFLSTAGSSFATSAGGTLAYQSTTDVSRLVWFDRAGREVGTLGTPGDYIDITLAVDGRRGLASRAQPGIGTYDVWSLDVARGTETRITSHPESDIGALWHPDGHSVVYSLSGGTFPTLHRQDLETGRVEELLPSTGFQTAQQISPDGRTLLYTEFANSAKGLWTLALAGGTPKRLLPPEISVAGAEFSPDGRFITFTSDESGRFELYVTPYPGPGERVHVSTGGAQGMRWVRNGREILYVSDDRHLMSVSVRTSPALDLGVPVTLFECPGAGPWPDFDVTPDGQRILAIVPQTIADRLPLNVVVNWPAAVGK